MWRRPDDAGRAMETVFAVLLFLGVVILVFFTPALVHAHDAWSDGSAVPVWVKASCCGPEDVHHYKPGAVKLTDEGYVLPDYPTPVPYGPPAQVSPDGDYWAFFRTYANGEVSPLFCFFTPAPGS